MVGFQRVLLPINLPFIDIKNLTLENLNKRTLVYDDEAKNRIIYIFDYSGLILNYLVLDKLKEKEKWDLINHPLIFNFINDRLLNSGWIYTLHIISYFTFLFIFCWLCYGELPSIWLTIFVSILSIFSFITIIFQLFKWHLEGIRYGPLPRNLWKFIYEGFTSVTLLKILGFAIRIYLSKNVNYNLDGKNYSNETNFSKIEKEKSNTFEEKSSAIFSLIVITVTSLECLRILRKSPCGIYIMMMAKIFKSFLNLALIWILTLTCFAFSFHIVMRNSGIQPWNDENPTFNSSVAMTMLQSFTKVTAMMVGELDANEILKRQASLASLLLILFEVIAVILLMNLMVSLAVGDVSELRSTATRELLKIKIDYSVDALHYSTISYLWSWFNKKSIKNIVVVKKNKPGVFSIHFDELPSFPNRLTHDQEKVQRVNQKIVNFFFRSLSKMLITNQTFV